VGTAETLYRKELSYDDLLDLDSFLNLVREFREPVAVAFKHKNPSGPGILLLWRKPFGRPTPATCSALLAACVGFHPEQPAASHSQRKVFDCGIGFDLPSFAILAQAPGADHERSCKCARVQIV